MSQRSHRFYQPYRPYMHRQPLQENVRQSPNLRATQRDPNNDIDVENVGEPQAIVSFADWLTAPSNNDDFSLVEMGRSFLMDDDANSMDYLKECLSPRNIKLGNPNLMEMKQLYTHTRSAEFRSQIELVAGSGLLSVHRSLCQEHLEGDVTGIHRLVKHQHLEPSSFGEADPTMSFSYVASDEHFRSINFVDEYGGWKLSLGQHLSEDTKVRHFLKQMLKKVVVNPNDFHKLTVRVRDGHDGLITLPLPFRATLKGFILHTAGREGDSAFAIALDAMMSSMVKEARRPSERQLRRRSDTGVANDEESVEP